jgi:hypothetical protein
MGAGSQAKQARGLDQSGKAVQDWQTLGQGSGRFGPGYDDYGQPISGPNTGVDKGIPATANLTYGPSGDVNPFAVGKALQGVQTDSAWQGTGSAFDNIDPSNWQGEKSAFSGMAPSAASGLAYDPNAAAGQRASANYFQGLTTTGHDPIAEADYQRRTMQAEQGRKASTDAALQAMELKGQGNAGGALAARTGGIQDEANARYQAGLDATAAGAARRDTAATAGAGINATLAQGEGQMATNKAQLMDAYKSMVARGIDANAALRATGLDKRDVEVAAGQDTMSANRFAGMDANTQANAGRQQNVNNANWGRQNTVNDTNTGLWNQTQNFNKVTAPQARFENEKSVTQGLTGARQGYGSALTGAAAAPANTGFQDALAVAPQIINAAGGGLQTAADIAKKNPAAGAAAL